MTNTVKRSAALLAAVVAFAVGAAAAQDGITFKHPLDDGPLDVPLPEGDDRTEAVVRFHETGENVYDGDEEALAAGEELYRRWCQACHMPDGSGRLGPNLIDDDWIYPRNDTDVGRFETVFAGAAGAMQAFYPRLSQDEILKVIAYTNSLRQQ